MLLSSITAKFWLVFVLILFRMGLFGVAHGWGAKRPPSLKSVTHVLQWWNLAQLYLTLRESKKIYEPRDKPLHFCWHQHFFTENQQILLYQEIQIYTAFWYIVSNAFNFFESLKIVLINIVTILKMPAQMATEIKIF